MMSVRTASEVITTLGYYQVIEAGMQKVYIRQTSAVRETVVGHMYFQIETNGVQQEGEPLKMSEHYIKSISLGC